MGALFLYQRERGSISCFVSTSWCMVLIILSLQRRHDSEYRWYIIYREIWVTPKTRWISTRNVFFSQGSKRESRIIPRPLWKRPKLLCVVESSTGSMPANEISGRNLKYEQSDWDVMWFKNPLLTFWEWIPHQQSYQILQMQGMQWKLLLMWYGQPCKPILRWESISCVMSLVYQPSVEKVRFRFLARQESNSDVVGSKSVNSEGWWDRTEPILFTFRSSRNEFGSGWFWRFPKFLEEFGRVERWTCDHFKYK